MGDGLLQIGVARLPRRQRGERAFQCRVANGIHIEAVAREFAVHSFGLGREGHVDRDRIVPLARDRLFGRQGAIDVGLGQSRREGVVEDNAAAGEGDRLGDRAVGLRRGLRDRESAACRCSDVGSAGMADTRGRNR